MSTEPEVISTTVKSIEEKIEKSVEKIAEEAGMSTGMLVFLLISEYIEINYKKYTDDSTYSSVD